MQWMTAHLTERDSTFAIIIDKEKHLNPEFYKLEAANVHRGVNVVNVPVGLDGDVSDCTQLLPIATLYNTVY